MAGNFSTLRTSNDEPSLFARIRTAPQLSPEELYALTYGASDSQFEKGLRTGAANLTANSFANEALSQEVSGNPAWERSRDLARQTLTDAQIFAPRVSSLRDVHSLGDAGDFIAGQFGQGVVSMLPTLGAALLARGAGLGKLGSFLGGTAAAYGQERGEAALNQYNDPTLAAAPVDARNTAASGKAIINAALESVIPTRLASSVLRRPTGKLLGHALTDAIDEGVIETGQEIVGFGAEKFLDPNRQLDPLDLADAFAGGFISGGGVSGTTRAPAHITQALVNRYAQGPQDSVAPIDLNNPDAPPSSGPSVAPTDGGGGPTGPTALDPDEFLRQVFGSTPEEDAIDLRSGAGEQTQRTKDYVSDTIERMSEAANTARNPAEFLRQVFSNSSEEAAADLRPDTEDPIVLNAADPAAALQQRDAERQQRAARFAEELLNDPATPDTVKERVASFNGDFTNPEAQAYVARNLIAQRSGEKLATAVADLIDLSKKFGSKARDLLDKGITAATDRIVKKNLQDTTPAEQAAFNKLIFDNLTDEAKANPVVRRRLPEIANAVLAFAARTGDLTPADLKTLSRLQDGLAIFRDPDAAVAQITKYAGLPRTEDSFLSRVKQVTNAQQDVRQPNSFLYSSLTEEAKKTLSQAQLKQLARLVDEFTLIDANKAQGDKVLAGLTAAFGSKENAQAVLDYYQQQNRADVRYDPNEALAEDNTTDDEENPQLNTTPAENGITERDSAPAPTYHFADAKALRPFRAFAGRVSSEGGMRRRLRESTLAGAALRRSLPRGVRVRPIKLSQYVADTGGNPEAEAKRIAADIKDRIEQHKARKDEDRTKQINELEGELSLMRQAYKKGGANAALDLYEVLQVSGREQEDTVATDADLAKMATLVKAKDAKDTRVTFQRTDGSKFTLSAESMWKTMGDKEGSGKGENAQIRTKRLFAEAVAAVLARPEVAKMVTPLEKILIDRKLNVWAKKKDNPRYRTLVINALKAAEGNLKTLQNTLDKVVDEYLEATDNEANSELFGNALEVADGSINTLQNMLDGFKTTDDETKFEQLNDALKDAEDSIESLQNTPSTVIRNTANIRGEFKQLSVAKDSIKSLQSRLKDLKAANNEPSSRSEEIEAIIDQNVAKLSERLDAAKDSITSLQKMLDDFKAAGNEYGSRREEIEAILDQNIAQLSERLDAARDGKGPLASNLPAQAVARQKLRMYRETKGQIDAIKLDEETDERDNDRPGIPGDDRKPRPLGPTALPRTRMNEELINPGPRYAEEDTGLGVGVERRGNKKSSQPKSKILSDAVVTALHDIAVKGNRSRLNTPEKVLRYAAMAREALNQLEQIPKVARTDMQNELLTKLRADFDQSSQSAFNWGAMFNGMKPTAEQREMLKNIVLKKSAMGADGGRSDKADKQKVVDEILRLRGKDVKVRIERLIKDIGGSGQYIHDAATGARVVEIAVNASSMLGAARHEAIHDLFRFLSETPATRAVARDLKAAAEAPHVQQQLRKLLERHPEAIKQLRDPEERVAYVYQFWAEGRLELHNTADKIFTKLRQFLRDVFGIVLRADRAESLLRAFHEGKFADPSTIQEVLADLSAKDGDLFFNKMEKIAPELVNVLRKVANAAPDRLRAFQNDALTKLADMFSSESGELGFIQKRFQQNNMWENKLADVLAGTTAKERRAALENLQAMKPPSSELEKKLVNFFDEMYDYMSDAGVKTFDSKTKKWVPLRKVKNYFPRVFDRHALIADRDGFISLLQKHGNMDLKQANAVFNALTHGNGQLDLAENEHALGFTPYAPSVQDRRFTFINPSNASEFAKYQVKDLADITTGYVKQAVHRAEYARMFGNDGEVITKLISESGIKNHKELENINKTVQALEGSLGYGMSATMKELQSAVLTLQNLIILPLALVSQMVDPIVLAARSEDIKDAGRAYTTAIKRLAGKQVDGEEMAKMLGIISQDSVLEAMGAAYGTAFMSSRMRRINQVFFRYNGMQGWNNSMRIAATAAGERYLIANRHNDNALAELGLTSKDVKVKENGRLDVSSPKVQEAMFRFVDQAVLRPSASNRPVWMSDPRFLLVAHLKQFTFAMHNVVLKRANRELANGNPKPWGILMMTMPAILAADMAKFALMGNLPNNWGFKEYLAHAVERSGLLGLGDFSAQAIRDVGMGKLPGEDLLGPTFENLSTLLRWIGGDPRTSFDDVIDRTIPGARFF